jgi:hypothetical protein
MSGGHFNYDQYKITQLVEDIKVLILTNNSQEKDQWGDPMGRNYPPEVIEKFVEAVLILKTAFAYAHCIDYLVCGDTGPDSFLQHLERELKGIENDKD